MDGMAKPKFLRADSDTIPLESPQPRLRRPPAVLNHSDSSSLNGMERSVSSFQTFVKSTPPPPNQLKPLPPIPGLSSQSSSGGWQPTRRSSSVYSRTVSHWAPTPESWRSRNLAASDLFLQPSVYSYSTPELAEKVPTPPMLQPRAYSPLINSPITSTCPSSEGSPCPSPVLDIPTSQRHQRPSLLLPPPPASVKVSSGHVKTVSLDRAKAALLSPGVTPLLPEEMRALAKDRSTSRKQVRKSRSMETPNSPRDSLLAPALPPLLNLADYKAPFFRPAATHILNPSTYKLPASKQQDSSKEVEPTYEPRGRTTYRSAAEAQAAAFTSNILRYGPPNDNDHQDASSPIPESRALAAAYHAILNEQQASEIRAGTPSSTESTAKDLKLVPQPLFFNPRQISEQRLRQYQQQGSQERSYTTSRHATPDRLNPGRKRQPSNSNSRVPRTVPLPLTLTPTNSSLHRRGSSNSGSIPISPPISSSTDGSPRPLLGRFASPAPATRARTKSPHLHNKTVAGRKLSFSGKAAKLWTNKLAGSAAGTTPRSNAATSAMGHRRKTSGGTSNSAGSGSESGNSLAGSSSMDVGSSVGARLANVFKGQSYPLASLPAQHHAGASEVNLRSGTTAVRDFASGGAVGGNMAEVGGQGMRKPSLFASAMEKQREGKANKRREELKRMIRVVPENEIPAMDMGEGEEVEWL